MSLRHGARLAALLVPALLLAPAAAHAEKVVFDDAVGDAVSVNLADGLLTTSGAPATDAPSFVPAPDEAGADVTRTVVALGRTRLAVTMHFRDLVLSPGGHSVDLPLYTPGAQYDLSVGREPGRRAHVDLFPPFDVMPVSAADAAQQRGAARPGECRGERVRYDFEADVVSVSVPTACLGTPRWVQVGVAVTRFAITPQPDGSVNFAVLADDGFSDTVSMDDVGRSTRVHRG